MFVIITYDVGVKRVNRIRKSLKKYLTWTQNSVFEGEITKGKLHKCMNELDGIINREVDSIYLYVVKNANNIVKDVYGIQKNFDDMFL